MGHFRVQSQDWDLYNHYLMHGEGEPLLGSLAYGARSPHSLKGTCDCGWILNCPWGRDMSEGCLLHSSCWCHSLILFLHQKLVHLVLLFIRKNKHCVSGFSEKVIFPMLVIIILDCTINSLCSWENAILLGKLMNW